jgi:transposase-like protein
MMKKEDRLSKQDKMDLVLCVLKNPKKMRELCGKYDIGVSTFYKWRNRFLHGGMAELDEYRTGPRSSRVETEKERELAKKLKESHDRINELATELEVLKKNGSLSDEGLS